MIITIRPENPTSDDPVELIVDNLLCPYYVTSKTYVDSKFIFNVGGDPVPPCPTSLPVPPSYWSVGRLKAGEYQVIFSVRSQEQLTQAFSVTQGELPFPEPAIPSIGVVGAMVLAVGLVLLANKSLKRTRKRAG